jgi:Zn-dependent protease with chaperone function
VAARATMDFFAAQAAARRRTAVLVAWFALAFLGTVASIWAGIGAVFAIAFPSVAHLAFSPILAAWVSGVVAFVTIVGASVHRARLAAGGGHAVARMLGGAPIDRRTADAGERRLVNVVEEMAIAAGLPVPALYVLPSEPGINAFAAGFSPDRSVVAVTRGALDELTRDELQGVVAHELSHVLNGDARLNLQLLALIGGITVLAAVGRGLARAVGETGRFRVRGRRGGSGAVLAAGLVIWLAGSVGALFGRLIRAAVSRQREFLADAAAVQFTRNPGGLAGALEKIARSGSAVGSAFAPEAAHLFFANGLATRWLATHPPIEDRIRRLVPHGPAGVARPAAPAAAAAVAPPPAGALPLTPSGLVASVGRPGPGHLADAARAVAALPGEVVAAARDPGQAAALVRALLADRDPAVRAAQLGHLADPALRAAVDRLAAALAPVSRADRTATLDLALAALDALPGDAAAGLVGDLRALAGGGRTTLHEWTIVRVVSRRVVGRAGAVRARAGAPRVLEDVQVDALDLLSALAWVGARDQAGAQAALDAALPVLRVRGWRVLPRDRIAGQRVEAALARLEAATPALQARILEACAACVLADGRVLPGEGELVRAVAASFGIPVPPLVAEFAPHVLARAPASR